MKHFFNLTKFGIVIFVLVTGAGGYFLGVPMSDSFQPLTLASLLFGLYFLSSGSFALNQYQERHLDALMPRTQKRPLPSGVYKPGWVLALGLAMIILGAGLCFFVSWKVGVLGLVTVFLYNIAYTIFWKPKTAFAAVPGAIPGAMPIALGYTAGSGVVFNLENIYFFLVMFLWQMPHFWALALKYQSDYGKASFPVLPLVVGDRSTLYYMGIYTFAYLALALGAPFFVPVGWLYLLIAMPFAFKVLWEFFRFVEDPEQKRWIHFFLWTTFSILIFVLVPAMDRWMPWIL